MPFVRVSRDKRGYEQISLLHLVGGRRGKPSKPKLLYVFRTPPGVKIGREPFDDELKQTLEARHPGVVFDWTRLSNIPVPAPDVEYWRERRKAEKAAKQARRAEELAENGESAVEEQGAASAADAIGAVETPEDSAGDDEALDDGQDDRGLEATGLDATEPSAAIETDVTPAGTGSAPVEPTPDAGSAPLPRRRRRRRGGRHRNRGARPDLAVSGPPVQGLQEGPAVQEQPERPPILPEDPPKEA